ncbi:MAG: Hsp20/alpha crystallin family protein [Candidatus Saccharibacteria bacterium]|nr:Hsp20/alpha crystallin family protein [Candidatus Saccharibacteria bacterium]
MVRQSDDLLMDGLDDELASALFSNDPVSEKPAATAAQPAPAAAKEEEYDTVPGQLAVDVYETAEQLIIKARTAGVNRNDLDVSIADGVLTISGTLSSGDDTEATHWHIQECYWGEFSRTLVLPVPVKEDEVKAVLKDGVLTIMFNKVKQEQAKKIQIQ